MGSAGKEKLVRRKFGGVLSMFSPMPFGNRPCGSHDFVHRMQDLSGIGNS